MSQHAAGNSATSQGDDSSSPADLRVRLSRAETLLRITSEIRYDQPLVGVLRSLAEVIEEETAVVASAVVLLDAESLSPIAQGGCKLPEGYLEGIALVRQQPEYSDPFRKVLAEKRTHVLREARAHFMSEPEYAWLRPSIDQIEFDTLVATPFISRPGTYGVVYLYYGDGQVVDDEEVAFGRLIAERAAPAMDNALLLSETQRRTSELEALFRADEALRKSLHLDDVIEAMAELAIGLLGADSSLVAAWDENEELAPRTTRGLQGELLAQIERTYRSFSKEYFRQFTHPMPASVVEDISEVPILVERVGTAAVGALVEVPIDFNGELWGYFSIGWKQPRQFNEADRRMFDAFSARATLAIQNALLFEQAQAAASNEERQRIARDLHDSVSQALYGIGLGARTARQRLGDGSPQVAEAVDYIIQLAESGLAETRALIFELMPESLEEQGLVLALQRQGGLTQARYGIKVVMNLAEEPALPLRTKEALYRIAQESLHNIAKHAEASTATVTLQPTPGGFTMAVIDDGRGFDSGGDFPGHFGLRSMEERARRLGATFQLESAPGAGTRITVQVPGRN